MFENCGAALCPPRYEHASTVKTTAFFVVGESVEYENAASARKRGGRAAIRAALLAIASALYVCGTGALRRIGPCRAPWLSWGVRPRVRFVLAERNGMEKEGSIRIPSGCAIAAAISREGRRFSGSRLIDAMRPLHDRSNGLGGGFAGYGIYPEYRDFYALHMFFDNRSARKSFETYLKERFEIVESQRMPTRTIPQISDEPVIWRYFVDPLRSLLASMQLDEREFVARMVMDVNANMSGCYVFSSGKNMGVFKAVGYPEDVGEFYRIDEYRGYSWTAHGRYPTNTPGWWGGAHPFSLLDFSVVHNGEISSYDANRRFVEMFGYQCTLQTDTEVITYLFDYLVRKKGLVLEEAAAVVAAPFWEAIESDRDAERGRLAAYLRTVFPSLLVTGPFSIVVGFDGGLMALNDRLKLRSMAVGEKGDMAYIASEEAAIRAMEPTAENIWAPAGGQPVVFTVRKESPYGN